MAIEKVVNIKVQETGFDDLNAKVNRLENSLDDLEQQNQSLRGSFASSGKSVLDNGGAMGLLNDATGGLAMTVKDAVEATDLFTKSTKAQTVFQKIATTVIGTSTGAMKAFRIALAATGIGLIVVALGLLVANFDKVQKYVQKGIDKFKGLGEGAKLLISFLFPVVGVVRLITAALEEMGVIDDDATKKAKKNAEERIKFLDKNKVSIEEKYESEIRLAKAAGKDTVELEEAKRKAILKTLYALNEAERARIKSGEATEDEIKRWNERQKEIKKVVEDGKVAILEQEKDREEKIKEINKKALEDRKARQEKAQQEEKERQAKAFEVAMAGAEARREFEKNQQEQARLFREEQALEEEEAVLLETQKIIDGIRKTKEIEDEGRRLELQAREAFESAKFAVFNQGLDLINQLAGKSKSIATALLLVEKGLAISQVVINASKSIASTTSAMAPTPLNPPFLAPGVPNPSFFSGLAIGGKAIATTKISAGLAIGNILAQTITKLSGNVGGGGSGGSGGGGGVAPSAPSFNLVGGTGTNQIAQSLAMQNKPIQAFVVGSAVTSQQELDRRAVSNATL